MSGAEPLLGGIELGGTKCVCSVGTGPGDIRGQVAVPTGTDPGTTLQRLVDQLGAWQSMHGRIEAVGIASFGPLDLDAGSPTYGCITSTGKPGWRFVDVVGALSRAFGVPVGFDTDVNGAALAEGRWGAARNLADFAYVTVGTGVGVGLVVNNALVHGFGHPELGHVRVARLAGDDWPGTCPLHPGCVEGLASGPAIAARAGMPAERIPGDSAVWHAVAHALAQLLHMLVLTTAPRRIILGGGVPLARPDLLVRVCTLLPQSLNGYLALEQLAGPIDRYIVAPGLGALAGPLGALALAGDAHAAHAHAAAGCATRTQAT